MCAGAWRAERPCGKREGVRLSSMQSVQVGPGWPDSYIIMAREQCKVWMPAAGGRTRRPSAWPSCFKCAHGGSKLGAASPAKKSAPPASASGRAQQGGGGERCRAPFVGGWKTPSAGGSTCSCHAECDCKSTRAAAGMPGPRYPCPAPPSWRRPLEAAASAAPSKLITYPRPAGLATAGWASNQSPLAGRCCRARPHRPPAEAP